MTAITATVDEVRSAASTRARQVDPAKAIAGLFLLPFLLVGWLLARLVVVVVYLWAFVDASFRAGWRRGRGGRSTP